MAVIPPTIIPERRLSPIVITSSLMPGNGPPRTPVNPRYRKNDSPKEADGADDFRQGDHVDPLKYPFHP